MQGASHRLPAGVTPPPCAALQCVLCVDAGVAHPSHATQASPMRDARPPSTATTHLRLDATSCDVGRCARHTEQADWRMAALAVLPRADLGPLRPCVPMKSRSNAHLSASCTSASAVVMPGVWGRRRAAAMSRWMQRVRWGGAGCRR